MTSRGKAVVHEDAADDPSATNSPLGQLLVHSSMPAAAVAVKFCGEDSAEETAETVSPRKHDLFSTFKRRAFSRISFKGESGPLLNRYRQTRFSSRRVRKRVVFKHGDCNVVQGNVAKRRRRYLQDIFTTLVDAQWRWTLLVFSMNFLLSWLGFALIWWLIAYSHGDLEPHFTNQNFTPCVEDIRSFTSCFLFSVETQHTIGYGAKHITDECPEAIFTLCIQSMTGVILQAFMVGIVFAKLSRPKKRTQTLLFSRNAVICQRDGQPCLMFRVGDMRKSHIIEAHVRAQMIRRKVSKEGELLPFFQTELKVGGDGEEDKIFFIWPTTIVHKIDRKSPLYRISASDMLQERFEIVVILEGVIESTGMTTQARSSYLPSEILWGHRFESIITFRKETGEYEVNYMLFNNTYEVDTPLCSAAELDRIRAMHHRSNTERTGPGAFSNEASSSSCSTISSRRLSLRSSSGDLHTQTSMPVMVSTALPNPISVIITDPESSCKRKSVTLHPDVPPSFYAQEETTNSIEYENSKNQEDYEHILEDINASLIKNKKQNGTEVRIQRNESKTTLDSKKSDARSNSIVEEIPESETRKNPSSRSNVNTEHCMDCSETQHSSVPALTRSSLYDGHRVQDSAKKTSFLLEEEANRDHSQNTFCPTH